MSDEYKDQRRSVVTLGDVNWAHKRIEELEAALAQQDDLVQAAVAAALREAAELANTVGTTVADFRALITPDAQAALDRVVAAERERCINLAATWSKDAAATIREGGE